MPTDVLMPAMGYDMTEGTLVRWLKEPGDPVKRGEAIAEIETDKAVVQVEAFAEGTLAQIVAGEGQVVPVGEVIAVIAGPGERVEAGTARAARAGGDGVAGAVEAAAPPPPPAHPQAVPPEEEQVVPATPPETPPAAAPPTPAPVAARERIRISPVASRLAAEQGIDVRSLRGTGPDGRILRRDVETAIAGPRPAAPPQPARGEAPAPPVREPAAAPAAPPGLPSELPPEDQIWVPGKLRQSMARRMAQSKGPAPHYYLTVDVDMTEAQTLRRHLNESARGEFKISVNDLLVRAVIITIAGHPLFNATWTQDGRLQINAHINIGIAVALPEGLIAPCLLDTHHKSLIQLAQETRDLAERTRDSRLRPEEYSAGTFTISNLGMFGVGTLVAIINPPQTAILGVGAVTERPAVRDGQVVARETMTLALSADHRVTTGHEGAQFLSDIKTNLENPVRLLL